MGFWIIVIIFFIRLGYYKLFPPVLGGCYYAYQGVTVTMIDRAHKVYLYYGRCSDREGNCPEPSVVIDWRDDFGLNAYLLFHEDKTVEVINGGGGYYRVQKDGSPKIFIKEYENPELARLLDAYIQMKSYRNLVQIYGSVPHERHFNMRGNAQVHAEYAFLGNKEE